MANKLLSKVINDLGSLPDDELKKLVKGQMNEADMLEALICSLPEGHIIFSPDQRVAFINNSAYHLLPSDRRRRMRWSLPLSSTIEKVERQFPVLIIPWIRLMFSLRSLLKMAKHL